MCDASEFFGSMENYQTQLPNDVAEGGMAVRGACVPHRLHLAAKAKSDPSGAEEGISARRAGSIRNLGRLHP
jgi:hypothetical protein